jgi:hypothetical protein
MTVFAKIALDPTHPVNHQQPPTLRCAHCREVFEPPFEEFFYRDANGPFGWRRWCKACYSEAPSIVARNLQRETAKAQRRTSAVYGVAASDHQTFSQQSPMTALPQHPEKP